MPNRVHLLLLLLVTLSITTGFAQTSYRVQAGQSLPAALTAAAAGDIIYVDGGIYGDITLTKKVILIGMGYFGAGSSASPAEATLGTVQFATGSANSVIMGFVATHIQVGASTITVVRNRVLGHIWVSYSGTGYAGWNDLSVSNVVVKQNYVDDELVAATPNSGTNTVSNFSFRNNIVRLGFASGGRVSGEYVNNTFGYKFDTGGFNTDNGYGGGGICQLQSAIRYKNNIMAHTNGVGCPVYSPSLLPPVFTGNVLVPAVSVPGNMSITTAQRDNLFLGWPTQTGTTIGQDARSQLKAGSVALTAGEGGTQAGAFGGDDPYVLSGIPFIPTITELTVPNTVTQGATLNITVKAQTNN